MRRLLIIGCGDIARRVIPLLRGHFRLYALLRHTAHCSALRAQGVVPVLGELDDRTRLHRLAGLADVVLHLAPPPGAGDRDLRTRRLLAALSHGAVPARFVYISTSGVYGDCGGARVDETRPVQPQTARARRRADAERQIRNWAARNGVNASILRVPGIYAADRLPLERIGSGLPAIAAVEDGYTNHIHADDLARILVAALRHGRPNRIYNASDDRAMLMGEYFDAVADAHGLPRPPRVSRGEARGRLSESLLSFMNESRRLDNSRMKKELRMKLTFPTVQDGLANPPGGPGRPTGDG